MCMKRMICMALACMLVVGVLGVPANAAETESLTQKGAILDVTNPRATGSFNMSVPANSTVIAGNSFPLEAGEIVTIKASYSPFSASVDFGLVDSDGIFHYFNISDGSIDEAIQVDESGNYTLQVRNNSSGEVKVTGFVKY